MAQQLADLGQRGTAAQLSPRVAEPVGSGVVDAHSLTGPAHDGAHRRHGDGTPGCPHVGEDLASSAPCPALEIVGQGLTDIGGEGQHVEDAALAADDDLGPAPVDVVAGQAAISRPEPETHQHAQDGEVTGAESVERSQLASRRHPTEGSRERGNDPARELAIQGVAWAKGAEISPSGRGSAGGSAAAPPSR